VGEPQMDNRAIIIHITPYGKYSMKKYSTVGHVHNIFELLKVAKMNYFLARNALKQLKHSIRSCYSTLAWVSSPIQHSAALPLLLPITSCYFFHIALTAVL